MPSSAPNATVLCRNGGRLKQAYIYDMEHIHPVASITYESTPTLRRRLATELLWRVLRSRTTAILLGFELLVLVMLIIANYQDTYDWGEAVAGSWPMLVLIACIPLIMYGALRSRLRSVGRRSPKSTIMLYSDHLTAEGTGSQTKLDYKLVDRLFKSKSGYFLKIDRIYLYLPKDQLTPEALELLRTRLKH
jgi:hypothetical protein